MQGLRWKVVAVPPVSSPSISITLFRTQCLLYLENFSGFSYVSIVYDKKYRRGMVGAPSIKTTWLWYKGCAGALLDCRKIVCQYTFLNKSHGEGGLLPWLGKYPGSFSKTSFLLLNNFEIKAILSHEATIFSHHRLKLCNRTIGWASHCQNWTNTMEANGSRSIVIGQCWGGGVPVD